MLSGAIFDGADGFAHLKLEVLEQRSELGFEFARAVAQLDVAFAREPGPLLIERVLLGAGGFAVFFKLGEFAVQLVEEASDIHLLRAEPLTGGGDDGGVEAETLGGLDAGRRAGNAEVEMVVGRERDFVHAGRGVEHAVGVGGVNLERGVVGGDERPCARCEEVAGDGDGERRAFFGIGGGAKLVEQDERSCRPARRERRSRFVMCAEKVESAASMDCASPMSARNAVKTGKLAAVAGTGKPACAIMASRAVVLRVTVLPPVLGPLMMSWRSAAVSSRVSGTTWPPVARRRLFEQGMAGGFEAQKIRRDGWSHAVVIAGKAGAGLETINQREDARAFD